MTRLGLLGLSAALTLSACGGGDAQAEKTTAKAAEYGTYYVCLTANQPDNVMYLSKPRGTDLGLMYVSFEKEFVQAFVDFIAETYPPGQVEYHPTCKGQSSLEKSKAFFDSMKSTGEGNGFEVVEVDYTFKA